MSEISKEYFLLRLRAISREVECMSDSRFNEAFFEGTMTFDYFEASSPTKITTTISIHKKNVE